MNALLSGTTVALTLCALAVTSHRWANPEVEPPGVAQEAPKEASEGAPESTDVEWRKSLAEAFDEARRTKRPLLAVFR